jgi:hypothetical protein
MQIMFIPHRKHLWASTACYRDRFNYIYIYIYMMFVRNRKHTYGPPRSVMGMAVLFYMQMIFVTQRKHQCPPPLYVTWIARLSLMCRWCSYLRGNIYGRPRPVKKIPLHFLCLDVVRTSQETHLWASTACYRDSCNCYA